MCVRIHFLFKNHEKKQIQWFPIITHSFNLKQRYFYQHYAYSSRVKAIEKWRMEENNAHTHNIHCNQTKNHLLMRTSLTTQKIFLLKFRMTCTAGKHKCLHIYTPISAELYCHSMHIHFFSFFFASVFVFSFFYMCIYNIYSFSVYSL